MDNVKNKPNYLAAIDYKNNRVFVLASPNLSAMRTNGVWEYRTPLTDEEIKDFDLVIDLKKALELVKEAKVALNM
jgi:hypothetical protein